MSDTITEVTVGPADLAGVFFDGTVVIATGTSGRCRVTFVGDHRPMRAMLFDIAESGEPRTAYVERYQITRVQPTAAGDGGGR